MYRGFLITGCELYINVKIVITIWVRIAAITESIPFMVCISMFIYIYLGNVIILLNIRIFSKKNYIIY